SDSLHSDSDDPANFLALGETLIREAMEDDNEPDLPPLPLPPPSTPTPATQSRVTNIPLSALFNFNLNDGNGLDFYWKGGIRIVEEELERLDAELAAEQATPTPQPSDSSPGVS
ncbi:hypothetical protein H0H81_012746, partial [Sphagnurus paluster]